MFLFIHPFLIYLLVRIVPELTQWKQCIKAKYEGCNFNNGNYLFTTDTK